MSRVSSGLSGPQSLTIVTSIDIVFTIFGVGHLLTKLPSAPVVSFNFCDKLYSVFIDSVSKCL